MFDVPQSLEQLNEDFSSEASCVEHLIRFKWPNGFICPRCGCISCYRISTRRLPLFQCAECHYQASPISGTVMEGSRTPLRKWFLALHYSTRLSPGTNAVFLSKAIGVTYKTAWLMLHKIRHAIGLRDVETQLCGFVHTDKASYSRPELSGLFLHPREVPVFVATSSPQFEHTHEVKIKIVPQKWLSPTGIDRTSVSWFKERHVQPEATFLCTVGTRTRRTEMHALPYHKMAVSWINSTFHGLGRRHLQAYLNEFCFMIGTHLRKSNPFESIAQLCSSSRTITYRNLTRRAG